MATSNQSEIKYTCVLTSCNRLDVLEKTLHTLFLCLDILPAAFILIEDSGNKKVLDVVAKFDYPIQVIINRVNLGQARSIDKVYAKVKTPYVFHCEDDWEFIRTGFIEESYKLLQQHPEVSLVQLRGREEHKSLKTLSALKHEGVEYFLATKKTDKRYFSYGYNPSLRRLKDYHRVSPLFKIGGEREVSWVFKKMGFVTAHLEVPAIKHMGEGLHIDDSTASKKGITKRLRSLNNIVKRTYWFFSGFPKYRVSRLVK